MKRRFDQIDVFSAVPLAGNPLAVVHASDGASLPSDDTMAAFARWTNLSETTFLLPPTAAPAAPGDVHGAGDGMQADYRVRIFTPGGELPFAGHPTLGSCWAWLAAGGVPRDSGVIVQQCAVGLVRIRRQGTRLAFAAPPLRRSGPLDAALLARIHAGLRLADGAVLQHQWVDNGPGWCAVMLRSADDVLALRPDWPALGDIMLGVVGPHPAGHDTAFEVRAFIGGGNYEDPVTGSLNASLAQWLVGAGLAPARYVAAQGTAMRRAGRVFIDSVGADVWVGGDIAPGITGTVDL